MAFEVQYTWDIGEPGNVLRSDVNTHETDEFREFVKTEMQKAEAATTSADVPLTIEVITDGKSKKYRSNSIGVKERRALYDVIANEHQRRGGELGTEGKADTAEMHEDGVLQDTQTDGDQGARNPDSE